MPHSTNSGRFASAAERAQTMRKAAALLAEGEYTLDEIAALVGVSKRQLSFWKNDMVFREHYAEARDHFAKSALKFPIARKRERMRALNDRWQRALRLIEERSKDRRFTTEPGYDTGLLVYKVKVDAMGQEHYEFEPDTAIMKELNSLEKQAAQEVGQWTEKVEHRVTLPDSVLQEANRLAATLGITVEELLSDTTALLTAPTTEPTEADDTEPVEAEFRAVE